MAGCDLNRVNTDGDTALLLAIKHGREDLALLMVDEFADLNKADALGDTALFLALKNKE